MAKRLIRKVKQTPKTENRPLKTNLEIEKKYLVSNYDAALDILRKEYGKETVDHKAGFWFCTNGNPLTPVLEIAQSKFLQNDTEIIKTITEGVFPVQDYDFLRIRVKNHSHYFITFKNKALVDNIERNVEYEFEVDGDTLRRVITYLQENAFIFYYNIKTTMAFSKNEVNIELSKLSDLVGAYLEVEVTGNNEKTLTETLKESLKAFDGYPITEEPTSYVMLFHNENKLRLKNTKLRDYSKAAMGELMKLI